MKKVSVITVNLNNARGLEKTICSVISQTSKEFEFIVIDGGSKDGSVDIIKKYAHKISYWVSEPDKGIYNAMNKGIEQAEGEYLIFINSEDELENNDMIGQFCAANPTEDIVCGTINYIRKEESIHTIAPKDPGFLFFMTNTLPHQASFIKKQLFQTVGYYDESLKIASDWKFFMVAFCKFKCTYRSTSLVVAKHFLTGISATVEGKLTFAREKKQTLYECFGISDKDGEVIEKSYHLFEDVHRSRLIKMLKSAGFLKKLRLS